MTAYTGIGWNVRRPPSASEDYKRTPADVERELLAFIEKYDPDWLVLLEVARYHAVLKRVPGYNALVFDDPGHGDNAILVRDDVPLEAAYDVEHAPTLAWWFTTRGTKSFGRAHVVAKIPGLWLGGVHTPPSVSWKGGLAVGPRLRIRTFRAMMASLRAEVARWRKPAHPPITTPAGEFVFGDWNEPDHTTGEDSPNDVARDLGYKIFDGANIDYAMGRGVTVQLAASVPEGRHGNGSDHPLLVFTVIVTTPVPATPTPQEPTMTTFTRADWKARPAGGGPGALNPARVEGIALHWPGMTKPLDTVAEVKAAIRGWQNHHMDKNGWSDIAYQEAIDQDGNVYVLRGLATMSGANGNTDLNERFGALLLVLAPGEQPSAKMLVAARGRIKAHRQRFTKSTKIVPHSAIRPGGTECPGDIIRKHIAQGSFDGPKAAIDPVKVDLGKRALERAADQSRNGPSFGKDQCLMRVRALYGAPAIGDFDGDGAADAEDGWKATKKRHNTETPVARIPAGVPIWWGGGSADHGHVAISAGGGLCWSTDIQRTGMFDKVPITDINRKWGLPFLGWTEDINGVRVYTAPASPEKEAPVQKLTGVQLLQRDLLATIDKYAPGIIAVRSRGVGKGVGARAWVAAMRTAIKAFR